MAHFDTFTVLLQRYEAEEMTFCKAHLLTTFKTNKTKQICEIQSAGKVSSSFLWPYRYDSGILFVQRINSETYCDFFPKHFNPE